MPPPPLLVPRFLLLCACGLAYFVALGIPVTVIPPYVEDTLGGSNIDVGLTAGAFGFTASIMRPFIGPLGDRRGRRLLVRSGALIVGLSLFGSMYADAVWSLVAMRLLTGVGEAAFFTGLASAIQDLSPPTRRGEAASYFSVVVYGGFIIGPLFGEYLAEQISVDAAFGAAAVLCVVSAVFAGFAPGAPPGPPRPRPRQLYHRAALRPALVLGGGLLGYSGFLAFVVLHAQTVGIEVTGSIFAVFAALVVTLRIVGARLPDRLGPMRTTTFALANSGLGLLVLALWQTPAGVYLGTAFLAVGQTFLFPALFVLAVDTAPEEERSHAIASFSVSFDLAVGIGGFAFGAVAEATSRPFGFALGAMLCGLTLAMAWAILPAQIRRVALAPT